MLAVDELDQVPDNNRGSISSEHTDVSRNLEGRDEENRLPDMSGI